MPWYQPNSEGVHEFKVNIFLIIMLRGAFEFCGSTLFIYTLKIALENNVNQGIGSAMLMLAGLMLTIMSWIVYSDKLSCPQIVGMTLVLGAIAMIGIFSGEAYITHKRTQGKSNQEDFLNFLSNKNPMVQMIFFGASAAFFLSFEAILIKWLVVRGVEGAHGAYLTLFFDGLYGLIMLLILSLCYDSGWKVLEVEVMIRLVIAGFCTSGSLVLVNYAIAKGNAGVSFSIANSFPVWHALFNRVFLG